MFPPQCASCNVLGTGLCSSCAPNGATILVRFPGLAVIALGPYEDGLRAAVLALKDGRRDVAEALGAAVAPLVAPRALLVPIPTTAKRRRVRGMDGVALVAGHAAAIAGADAFCRRSSTDPATRSAAARARSGWPPAADSPATPASVAGKRVTLFDDVCTTGSTLRDCAAAVREAGGLVEDAVVIAVAKSRDPWGDPGPQLTPLDELFLQRAYELAARAAGETAPNPPVGAVVVRDGRIVGEGYHRRAGAPARRSACPAQRGFATRATRRSTSRSNPAGIPGERRPARRPSPAPAVARVVAGHARPDRTWRRRCAARARRRDRRRRRCLCREH